MTAIQLEVRALARALGGEVSGRNRILAPGPGHSRQDRSMSVHVDTKYREGFWVTSFADDDEIQCRDHVRALAGLPAWAPAGADRPVMPRPVLVAPAQPDEEEERAAAWRHSRMMAIWEAAKDPRGTIVERYLNEERGLNLPVEIAGAVLRFHPACPWRDDDGNLLNVPAMVAAMRCIQTDKLTAVHRRRLSPDGRKVGKPKMLGTARGSAIKLDADDAVTVGLAVGEGVETVLAARQLGFKPAWAVGSAEAIGKFPILSGVEALTLLEEHDESGTNKRAVEACGLRWHQAGREVIAVAPKFGKDINDAINGRAA